MTRMIHEVRGMMFSKPILHLLVRMIDEERNNDNASVQTEVLLAALLVKLPMDMVINSLNQVDDTINILFVLERANNRPEICRFEGMSPSQLVKSMVVPLFHVSAPMCQCQSSWFSCNFT